MSENFKCEYCFDNHDRLYLCNNKERAYFVAEKQRLESRLRLAEDVIKAAEAIRWNLSDQEDSTPYSSMVKNYDKALAAWEAGK